MAIFTVEPPTWDETKMTYLCYQKEFCPTTNKEHWQVYVEFKDSYAIKYCQKYLNSPNCHIEKRQGTPYEARDYCKGDKKNNGNFLENSFKEFGDINKCPLTTKKKGERSDLKKNIEIIKNGGNLKDIDSEMVIKYSKGFKDLINIRDIETEKHKTFKNVDVYILYGCAGSGKTRAVYEKEKTENIYKLEKTKNEIYFNNYNNEKILLIDDFYGWIPWSYLLQLLDGYPQQLNVKYGTAFKNWDKVYITSNEPYENWYNKTDTDLLPLTRRITYISEFNIKIDEIRKPKKLDFHNNKIIDENPHNYDGAFKGRLVNSIDCE